MALGFGSFFAGLRVPLSKRVRPFHDRLFDAFVGDLDVDELAGVLPVTRERVWDEMSSKFDTLFLLTAARGLSALKWRVVSPFLKGEGCVPVLETGSSFQTLRSWGEDRASTLTWQCLQRRHSFDINSMRGTAKV